nr:reverse transcriptase domain-containing protein [Tanacetum cinerariifolium]
MKVNADDMVIKSDSEEEMMADVTETLKRLRAINLKLNPKKCSFGVEEGIYSGYLITKQGIRADPSMVKAISTLRPPKTVSEMQNLNKKIASLSRFLSKSAEKTLPFMKTLKSCTSGKMVQWTKEADEACRRMKECLASLPTMVIPTKGETLTMYLATSKENESAILMEERGKKQILIYFKHRLQKTGKQRTNKSKEKNQNQKMHGNYSLMEPQASMAQEQLVANQVNGLFEARQLTIKLYLEKTKDLLSGLMQSNNIIKEVHEGSYGMHSGPRSVVSKITRLGYHWPSMHKDAKELIHKCEACQIYSSAPRKLKQEMTSIMSAWPFSQWGIDIVGPLPTILEGARFLVVAIDYFTKWVEAKPLISTTGKHMENFIWEHIVCRFERPQAIISDNGKQFVEGTFQIFCKKLGTLHASTSVYHPRQMDK